jgi:hypothetical protein
VLLTRGFRLAMWMASTTVMLLYLNILDGSQFLCILFKSPLLSQTKFMHRSCKDAVVRQVSDFAYTIVLEFLVLRLVLSV